MICESGTLPKLYSIKAQSNSTIKIAASKEFLIDFMQISQLTNRAENDSIPEFICLDIL